MTTTKTTAAIATTTSETSDRKTEIWGRGRSYGLKGDNTDRYMSEL